MTVGRRIWSEKNIHLFFEVSLWLKAIMAVLEIVGGILAYFVSRQFLLNLVIIATRGELAEDPRDMVANYLLQTAEHFSISEQHFTAFYLLGHGIVKLFVIVGLLRQKLWYYPVGMVVFGLFIVYQLYQFSFTHSLWLIFVSALDAVVVLLTWHEYRYLRGALTRTG